VRKKNLMDLYIIEVYDAEGAFLGYHRGAGQYDKLAGTVERAKWYPKKGSANSAIACHYPKNSVYGSQFMTKIVRYVAVRMEE
jgi:hypothetical protein